MCNNIIIILYVMHIVCIPNGFLKTFCNFFFDQIIVHVGHYNKIVRLGGVYVF